MKQRSIISISVVCLFISCNTATSNAQITEEAARHNIEVVLHSEYGLSPIYFTDFEKVETGIRSNADLYLRLIERQLIFPSLDSLEAYSDLAKRYSKLRDFLLVLRNDKARQMLRNVYYGSSKRLDQLRQQVGQESGSETPGRLDWGLKALDDMQSATLTALAAISDSTLLSETMNQYDEADLRTQAELMKYIRRFRFDNKQVQNWLKERQ